MSVANVDCFSGLNGSDRGNTPAMEPKIATDQPSMDEIVALIWSLEVRAALRESAAIASTDSMDKYRLTLESCELREELRRLRSRHTELVAAESAYRIDIKELIQP